jgi:hypothetical protein
MNQYKIHHRKSITKLNSFSGSYNSCVVDPIITSMGCITQTSSEKEMSTLIRQAWCYVKVAAPPQARVSQANYLTTPNLKQFSISLQERAGHQIC